MADWTDLDVNSLLPGEPFTSAIALAYEENPRAIAEQASGAPKIADKTVAGSGTVTISGLDDFGGIMLRGYASATSSGTITVEISVEYSTDDGGSFSSSTTLDSVTDTTTGGVIAVISASAELFIDFSSGSYKIIIGGMSVTENGDPTPLSAFSSGTISGLDIDVTDIRISGFDVLFATPQGGESAV